MEPIDEVTAPPENETPPPALQIRGWNRHYENHRTRILKRMDWVPIPNHMDSAGYRRLISHPDGPAHFGVWLALVEIASRCPLRGTLERNGQPLTVADLSVISGIPEAAFVGALSRLMAEDIGWIEYGSAQSGASRRIAPDNAGLGGAIQRSIRRNPALDPALPGDTRKGTEGNGREGKRTEDRAAGYAQEFSTTVEKPSSFVSDPTTVKPKAPSRGLARDVLNPQRIDGMRRILHDYMAMKGTGMDRTVSPPDDGIVTQCLMAAGLTPLGEVAAQLRKLFQNGQSPRHESGPKSYAWFPAVLARQFIGICRPVAGEVASVPAEVPLDCVAGQPASGTGILPGGADAENQPGDFVKPDEALISRVMARAERANGWQAAGEDFETVAV